MDKNVSASIVNGKKMFIPLENNPETVTTLARALGIGPPVTFHDVYSLTDASLLAFVPRPALALIFLCSPSVYHEVRDYATPQIPIYKGCGADEPVTWIRQTIGNACGTMALIHSVANGPLRKHILPGSTLDKLLLKCVPLLPEERAQVLYDSQELEAAHMNSAAAGDSTIPSAENEAEHHFISFVKGDDGVLWELEGGVAGPIQRGLLAEGEDVLSDSAIEMGVGNFMKVCEKSGDIHFSIVAVCGR